MRAVLLLALVAYAAGGAVELDENNFQAEVTDSGKNAFIKHVAIFAGCGHAFAVHRRALP